MIYRWVSRFRTHGTVHNLNCKDTNRQSHSGRPKSSRTPHNVAAARDSVVHSPSKSVRRRSQELGINQKSVQKILIADRHMYLYSIQIKQKLTSDDMRMVPIPTLTNHWHGFSSVSLNDWSAWRISFACPLAKPYVQNLESRSLLVMILYSQISVCGFLLFKLSYSLNSKNMP